MSMHTNPFLARFVDTTALVDVSRVVTFETLLLQAYAVLESHPEGQHALASISAAETAAGSEDSYWPEAGAWDARYKPYVVSEGVLQIPVKGVLLNDLNYQVGSYATGYPYIRKAFDRGMSDPNVRGIALVIDSPGGEVAGNFDLVDHMYGQRGKKPVKAFAAENAYSAAYSIASVADSISVTRSGGVGSIGVVTSHVDYSKYLAKVGLAVTFISAPEGGYKTEGNPYEPLSADAKARIQERINALYAEFVSTVARNRSMDEQAIRDTQALTFSASQAIEKGLADSISTFDDAMAAFAAELKGAPSMTDEEHRALMAAEKKRSDDAIAAAQASATTAAAESAKAAVAAEKTRISGILALDEAKDRPKLAAHLAHKTEMSVDDAKGMLVAAAKETPVKATKEASTQRATTFEDAMRKGNPNLHQSDDESEEDRIDAQANPADAILANYHAAGGYVSGMGDDKGRDKNQRRGN